MGKKKGREEYVSTFTGFFKNHGAFHFFKGLNLERVIVPIFFLEFSNISLCLKQITTKTWLAQNQIMSDHDSGFFTSCSMGFQHRSERSAFFFNGIYTPEN